MSDDLGVVYPRDPDGPCRDSSGRTELRFEQDMVFGPNGLLYVADLEDRVVRRNADGSWEMVVGCGERGFFGDGGLAVEARLSAPSAFAFGPDGAMYVADKANHRVRVVRDGVIETFAGSGDFEVDLGGFSGDGGPATAATLNVPKGVAVDDQGVVYIADTGNHRIRRVGLDGTIDTIAGTGVAGFAGDGGPAVDALLDGPTEMDIDGGGLWFVDSGHRRVRTIDADGVIRTVAGTGDEGAMEGDGLGAVSALHADISALDLLVEADGSLVVMDALNLVVWRVHSDGRIERFAGTGPVDRSSPGEGESALDASFKGVGGASFAPDESLYLSTGECEMRQIDSEGRVWAVDVDC